MWNLLCLFVAAPSFAAPPINLSAVQGPEGRVLVSWSFSDSLAPRQIVLYRSHLDLAALASLDLAGSPITRFDLGAAPARGRFTDSLLADGQTYAYYLKAVDATGKNLAGPVAKVTTPARSLAPGACDAGCALWVDKVRYVLEVRREGRSLKRYPIGLGADPVNRKLHQDNRTTPEGTYRISYRKPNSQFHKALGLDYPNAEDRARYARARRAGTLSREEGDVPDIGGAVQIHGGGPSSNWTWGCVAMENADMDEIFAQAGLKAGTLVLISGSEVQRASFTELKPASAEGFHSDSLRNGDMIFQTSRSGQSKPIQLATRSPWSHCGIVFLRGGKPYVFEAAGKVKRVPFKRFIGKGDGKKFVVKRLKDADSVLTPEALRKMKAAGEAFDGKPYDSFFGWADDRIYCSELMYKIYRNALGIEIGRTRKLKDFDLSHPVVAEALKQRYGGVLPLDEPVISPADMHDDKRLVTVYSNF